MMKLSTWRHIASRQIRYRSLLQERLEALLPEQKDTRTLVAVGKLMGRTLRHQRRMTRHEARCAAILKAAEDPH
jgi:hypothetical protein